VSGRTGGGIRRSGHDPGADVLTIKYSGADGSVLWQQRYKPPVNRDDYSKAVAVEATATWW
jgi:hypothetical protein